MAQSGLGQCKADDGLIVHIEVAGRHETQPRVEPGRPAVLRHVAGQQLGRALRADEVRQPAAPVAAP